jgi:hypothetical protein
MSIRKILAVIFLLCVPHTKAQNRSCREIDTSIVLGAFENHVIAIDSARFVYLSIVIDDGISLASSYNADSIMYYENRLFQRLELSNIDTLFLEGFLHTCDIGNILMRLKNIDVLYLYGYGSLQVVSHDTECDSRIRVVQIAGTEGVELDLSLFELLKTETLIVDTPEADGKKCISIKNRSAYLDQLIFTECCFPGFRRFVKRNRLKHINDHLTISQEFPEYPRPYREHGLDPHGRKL